MVFRDGGRDVDSVRRRGQRLLMRHFRDKLLPMRWSEATVSARVSVLTLFIVAFSGCGEILGIDDITSCWDATGFEGRGCYRTGGGCKLTKDQLPNACTDSICVPFDNQVHLGLSAASDLPKLTAVSPGLTDQPAPGGTDDCPTNRVVVAGSNAIVPILSYLSAELASATNPVTILYQAKSSCVGAETIFKGLNVAGEFQYWTRDVTNGLVEHKCQMSARPSDIGVSDVFEATCGFKEDANVAIDAQGPIQAMIFVVPKGSAERAISAEAARLVYGFGGTFENKFTAEPWTNINQIQRRGPTSGTQNMIGAFIGVPSASFLGVENANTSAMIASVQMAKSPEDKATIGLLDVVNGDPTGVRVSLRVLAFQAEAQNCAFLPDSTGSTLDKRNVRDGHYVLWGPIHIYKRPGAPDIVRDVVDYLSIERAPDSLGKDANQNRSELIKIAAGGSLVPSCAMRVQRSSEGALALPFVPERSCGCYFDQLTSNSESTCATCKTDDDCKSPDAPKCNFGFCEQQ